MKVDLIIAGGGLAGLTAGIVARRAGYSVVLVERKRYPFHKVCGEYISNEARALVSWLGVPFEEWKLPEIQRFGLSSPTRRPFEATLPLGGFGVSRYRLDEFLANRFCLEGGILLEETKATDVQSGFEGFTITTTHSQHPMISGRVCLGAFGRNKPEFAQKSEKSLNTSPYVGVKYHLVGDFERNKIELHHFPGGYCGISKVEEDKLCLCYLLQARYAVQFKGDFQQIESELLSQNPQLGYYLKEFKKITPAVTTSGIHFRPRPLHQNGMIFLGDSAGMIPPLAGNGMAMAMHSAVMAVELAGNALENKRLTQDYSQRWHAQFSTRLRMGRTLQSLMEKPNLVSATISAFRLFPSLFSLTARQTHGISIPIPDFRAVSS